MILNSGDNNAQCNIDQLMDAARTNKGEKVQVTHDENPQESTCNFGRENLVIKKLSYYVIRTCTYTTQRRFMNCG